MKFSEYEVQARKTKQITHPDALTYCVLGLSGEAGEITEKRKKQLRGGTSAPSNEDIIKELGDVLWYLTILAEELGTDLETVAKKNLQKIQNRQERGVIHGSGDNR